MRAGWRRVWVSVRTMRARWRRMRMPEGTGRARGRRVSMGTGRRRMVWVSVRAVGTGRARVTMHGKRSK